MANYLIGTINNDVLVGSVSDENVILGGRGDDVILGGLLDDVISGGAGNDIIYGDQPGPGIDPYQPLGYTTVFPLGYPPFIGLTLSLPPSTSYTGDDVLSGGAGDDIIYGDRGDGIAIFLFATTMTVTNQTVISDLTVSYQTTIFGNDTLMGDAGNDVLVGDAGKNIKAFFDNYGNVLSDALQGPGTIDQAASTGLIAAGQRTIADGLNSHAVSAAHINENVLQFGNDIMSGGTGNDTMTGDYLFTSRFDMNGGGVAIASNAAAAESIITHYDNYSIAGHDIMTGGVGDDVIYGDSQAIDNAAQGGFAQAVAGGHASTFFTTVESNLIMGDDILSGGSGKDIIYGDLKLYYNTVYGGVAIADGADSEASSALILDETIIKMGNDTISGGEGNDYLVGDADIIGMEVIQGMAIATNGATATSVVEAKNFLFQMGDDTVLGGSGNDVIIGDVDHFELLDQQLSAHVANDHLVVSDHANNQIIWGNDKLYGGGKQDTFKFTLFTDLNGENGTQGFDKIYNFNLCHDTLVINDLKDHNNDNLVNMADLLSTTTLQHQDHNTILNFAAGGSITLVDRDVHSLNDLHMVFGVSTGI